jgi:hypothetical protein
MKPLILAIEPDRRQAAKITTLARTELQIDIVIADSTELALEAIARRVPDLILTSLLLSRKDEALLTDRLRELDAAGTRVPTLVVPVLGAPRRSRSQKGLLTRLRGTRGGEASTDGCDPAVFAEQIAEYLERAAAERKAVAVALEDQKAAMEDSVYDNRLEAGRTRPQPQIPQHLAEPQPPQRGSVRQGASVNEAHGEAPEAAWGAPWREEALPPLDLDIEERPPLPVETMRIEPQPLPVETAEVQMGSALEPEALESRRNGLIFPGLRETVAWRRPDNDVPSPAKSGDARDAGITIAGETIDLATFVEELEAIAPARQVALPPQAALPRQVAPPPQVAQAAPPRPSESPRPVAPQPVAQVATAPRPFVQAPPPRQVAPPPTPVVQAAPPRPSELPRRVASSPPPAQVAPVPRPVVQAAPPRQVAAPPPRVAQAGPRQQVAAQPVAQAAPRQQVAAQPPPVAQAPPRQQVAAQAVGQAAPRQQVAAQAVAQAASRQQVAAPPQPVAQTAPRRPIESPRPGAPASSPIAQAAPPRQVAAPPAGVAQAAPRQQVAAPPQPVAQTAPRRPIESPRPGAAASSPVAQVAPPRQVAPPAPATRAGLPPRPPESPRPLAASPQAAHAASPRSPQVASPPQIARPTAASSRPVAPPLQVGRPPQAAPSAPPRSNAAPLPVARAVAQAEPPRTQPNSSQVEMRSEPAVPLRPESAAAKTRSNPMKAPGRSALGDVLTALELDLVQMRTEPAGSVSAASSKQSAATREPIGTPPADSSRERAREKKRDKGPAAVQHEDSAPVQDEWGFFDPQQCGFSALLTKLDEISEDEKRTSKKRA